MILGTISDPELAAAILGVLGGFVFFLLLIAVRSDGGTRFALVGGAVLAALVLSAGAIGERIYQNAHLLPSFADRCRGQLELSVDQSDQRSADTKKATDTLTNDLGCQNPIKVIVRKPFPPSH